MKHINWDIDWGAVFVVLVCIVLLCLAIGAVYGLIWLWGWVFVQIVKAIVLGIIAIIHAFR